MIFRFDRFQADDVSFRLTADDVPVPLEPKTLRLLLYLLENRGRLLRKQEILDAVWAEASVTENALTRAVGLLRRTLEDDSREPRFIATVPTIGYRFIAEVETAASGEVQGPAVGVAGVQATAAPLAVSAPPAVSVPPPVRAPPAPSSPEASAAGRRPILRLAAITGVCVVLLGGAGWLLAKRLHAAPAIRSLAVLPLNNLSGDPSQNYFADGMTDELITQLARIPNLRVVSRTSVMAERDVHLPLPEIARQLGVDAIVEGSIVRSGGRVRVTAQLIDARTDRHLWAQSFEGPAGDILVLQDTVAQQIAAQARLVILPPPPRRAVDPAAHDAYLRGLYFFNKQDLPHSAEYFQQAISLDPQYASAYSGYATVLDAESAFGLVWPENGMPKALAAARRAIQLDPNDGEAYTELGSIQTIYDWDWDAAGRNLARGIALNPNDSIAEFKYAVYLDGVDRPDDAVTHMNRALQLDPLSFLINRRLGATLYLARQYDAALAQLQKTGEMEHRPGSVENYLSLIYEQKGQRDEAVEHDLLALRADQPELDAAALQAAYERNGWEAYWRARTEALAHAPQNPCTEYEIGVDDIRVKDFDGAFEALQHAADRHCFATAMMRVDPMLDPLRGDARFAGLLRLIHQ